MTTTQQSPSRTLTQGDLESVNHFVCNAADDIAVSISRSFERLEERVDGMEARLYSRLADIEVLLAEIRAEEGEPKRV